PQRSAAVRVNGLQTGSKGVSCAAAERLSEGRGGRARTCIAEADIVSTTRMGGTHEPQTTWRDRHDECRTPPLAPEKAKAMRDATAQPADRHGAIAVAAQ